MKEEGRRQKAEGSKRRLAASLEERFFLRLHMFWILTGTILGGLLTTKILLELDVNNLGLRYFLAVGVAYLVFLLLIRVWLWYVRVESRTEVPLDAVDLTMDGADVVDSVPSLEAPTGCADVDEGIIGLVFVLIVLGLVVAGVFVIYLAPALLTEVAFEAALAAALVRKARRIDRPGWVGKVWQATIWPFLVVLISAAVLGWAAQHYCPTATRLREVWHCARAEP